MKMRERLIELLKSADEQCADTKQCENCIGFGKGKDCVNHLIADYLLKNGVVVLQKIKNYEDYCIDEYGNIYSLKSHRYINQQKGKDGYYYVNLCKNGERKRFAVHRLVATHFIDNPLDLPMVNHKDENKQNNEFNNLEWCTAQYNANYGNARIKQASKVSKPVVCIETGETFPSMRKACEIKGIHSQHIYDCCKGKKQTCGGYHWRYASQAEQALERSKE